MKIADERISSAKVFVKSINTQLKKSFVGFFVKNADVILLFTGENVSESDKIIIVETKDITLMR